MKRNILLGLISEKGFEFLRSGGRHDIYAKGKKIIPVPRHNEVNENTAKKILKDAGY